jgi:hypothetical protein
MRRWLNKYLIFLFVFLLLMQASYGQELTQTNDTNQSQGISCSPATTTQNISIELNSTSNLPVRETTVQVLENGIKKLELFTDENGLAFFQAKKNETYTFVIKSENYDNVTMNITIVPGTNTIKFTLKSKKDSGFLPLYIPAIIGFVTFLYWFIRFNHYSLIPHHRLEKLFFTSLLAILTMSWPVILLYLFLINKENILLGGLSFPIYIVVAALLGVLSYLLLSIEEIFAQTIPKYKRNSIVWGYIRRITIAPYIAILGVYVLLDAAKMQNIWFILLFSFIAGMFTKTIEDRLYSAVQGFLPEEKLKEFKDRGLNYSIENSELVIRLNVDADVAYTLFENNIENVDQLALLDINRLKECLKQQKERKRELNIEYILKIIKDFFKHRNKDEKQKECEFELECPDIKVIERIKRDINPEYLNKIIENAKKQIEEIDKLKIILNLTTSDLDLLINKAEAYSINEFAYLDLDSIDWGLKTPAENKRITDLFKQKQIKAKSIASYEEELIFLTLNDLKKLHEDFKDETLKDYMKIVILHAEIREKRLSNWSVENTKKLIDLKIEKLDDLKTLCINQGKDKIKEYFEDSSGISELIDKIIEYRTPSS